MILNLNDPDSIVSWWKVLPDQHSAYLDYKLGSSQDFAPAIREAQRRIAEDPELCSLQARCARQRDKDEARRSDLAVATPHHELRRRELAAA